MLVLTRKLKESIMIGDKVEVKVIAIEGDQIKLGIEAPKDVEVHRKEVYVAIQEENRQATEIPINKDLLKSFSNQVKKNQK